MDYKKLIRSRELRLKIINLLRFVPSEIYLPMIFWIKNGKRLNLNNPKTYCDKLNWLKLHEYHPEFTRMADKITVRDYVKEVLGEDICLPMLGAWERYDDIDFDTLPDRFVLKCNHDSQSTNVFLDKSAIDHEKMREFYDGRLAMNPYDWGREYPYRDIKPMIVAEEYMIPDGCTDLNDYKFLCFGGKPMYMFIATGRTHDCRCDFFDMDFNHVDMHNTHPNSDQPISKPALFEQMRELAERLAQGLRFVRIDLYEIDGKIYFGEFTFFDAGGLNPKRPEKWEYKLGELLRLD